MATAPRTRNRSSATSLVTQVHEWPFAASDARVFITVAEAGSFARAAQLHAMSPSAVSKSIRRLEDALGARLLTRTTRSLHLTDEGLRFHELASRAFALLGEAFEETRSTTQTVKGLVRIGMPPLFGTHLMPHVLGALRKEHPQLAVELVSTMRISDLVDRGLDLVIAVGELPPSSFHARPLGWGELVVVAAPGYLKARVEPRSIDELRAHDVIGYITPDGRTAPWFFAKGPPLALDAPLRADDMHHVAALAVAGLGIAQLPLFVVADAIAMGTLRRLLTTSEPPPKAASLVFPASRALPRRVRVVLEHLTERLTPLSGTSRRRPAPASSPEP